STSSQDNTSRVEVSHTIGERYTRDVMGHIVLNMGRLLITGTSRSSGVHSKHTTYSGNECTLQTALTVACYQIDDSIQRVRGDQAVQQVRRTPGMVTGQTDLNFTPRFDTTRSRIG